MTTLPAAGSLKLSGVDVTVGQVVTAANITSGLLTYAPAGNANGTGYASYTFQVQDGGGTANGGIDLDASPNTHSFNVTALNDAPVNSVPPAQSTLPNTVKVFSTGNGNLISISDVDAAGATVQVQLVSTNGATTLSGTAGLAFSVGDGTADATMTFTGTVAAVNTALSGLSFNPTPAFTGAASLQILTADQGNTGTGGTLTDNDTVAITVTSGPSCATEMVTNGGFEGGTGWTQSPAGVVTSGAGTVAARTGTWRALLGGNGTGETESVTQSVTIPSGCTASLTYYLRVTTSETSHPFDYFRAQVNGVTLQEYNDINAGASYVLRTLDLSAYAGQMISLRLLSVDDGSIQTSFWLDDVSITGGPTAAPVATTSGGTTAHTENVPLAVDSGITVTDTDSANMASGAVSVGAGYTAGQDVLAFANQNGITGSWSAPTMTLTGSATKAQWQTALRSVTYNNTSNTPNTGNRTINFMVNDGSLNSNTGAKVVSVTAVNDAPANSVPGAQTTNMNTAKVFSTGNSNLISITDADAAGGTMQVQLVSTNGATTLSTLTGLSFSVGDGAADATMTFTGSFAAVNTALSGLSFNPTTTFTGAASLQVVTADQGNTGSGGTQTDSDTITITVASASYLSTITGTTGLLGYWRLGESTISGDAMAGTAGATLQSRTGEVGTTWTKHALSNADAVLTDAGRIRKNGTATWQSLYFTSPQPATPNYTVEADVYVRSNLADDMVGVIGRVDTSNANGTYYLARYEQPAQKWMLYKRVNGSWDWLGESAQSLTALSTYRLALTMSGSTIRVLVDGVEKISVTDSGISAAGRGGVSFGFGAAATTVTNTVGFHLDNFRITPPVADSKGTNNGDYFAGVTTGQPGAITGDANTAVLFDGVDDYASVSRTIQDDFSIEFWFKSSQSAGTNCSQWWEGMRLVDAEVSGPNSDFGVSLCQGKVIAGVGSTGDVSIVSPLTYNNNAWHHVVFTRTKSAAAMQLYVDGVSVITGTPNNTGSLTASSVITFGRAPSGGYHYSGLLDEIAVYDVVLSGATVAAHYAAAQ